MEQACSTRFEPTAGLPHPGFHCNSQFYLGNRKLAFLNSLCMNNGMSSCCRIPVTSIASTWALKGNDAWGKNVPKASRQNMEGANGSEAEAINKDAAGGSLKGENTQVTEAHDEDAVGGSSDAKSTEAIEEVQTISKIESKQVKVNLAIDSGLQPLKWPLWLLGPSLLLATGAMPTLWLPFSSILSGCNAAGLLALTGLDGIFNMGATFFLLMADVCARPKKGQVSHLRIPFSYKFWNLFLNLVGFAIPSLAASASWKGLLQPQICLVQFAAILGPYLMLLLVQMLAEMLTWHWKSPVWLIVPVVYEAYRILQLTRGLGLSTDLNAPPWLMEGIKGLVAWWALVLGMQLMRIAWYVGHVQATQHEGGSILT